MDADSPFSKHLNTNFIPSPQEKLRISELIEAREDVAGSIDEEIAQAERALQALKDHRAVHTKYVQEHKALLSPIRQVPHDILADIFLACLPPKKAPAVTPARGAAAARPTHPAIVFSHVCQQWRQLALQTRLLWTHLNIVIPEYPLTPHRFYRGPPLVSTALADQLPREIGQLYLQAVAQWESKVDNITQMTKLWIDRAAPCPLTVSFRSPLQMVGVGHLPEDGARCLDPIIDVLCAASARWKEVRFNLFLSRSTASHLTRLLSPSPEDVPLLESVCLFAQDGERRPNSKLYDIANSGILKSESLHTLALPVTVKGVTTLPVDWEKLTTLSIGAFDTQSPFEQSIAYSGSAYTFTTAQALTILKKCPNLINCSFIVQAPGGPHGLSIFPTSDTDWIPGEVVSLPELRSMTIRGSSKALFDFPPHLDLPSIRKLDIACSAFRAEDEELSGLVRWITTFGVHLEDVSFNYGCITQPALELCLEHLSNVTDLNMVSITKVLGYGRSVANSALFDNATLQKFISRTQVGESDETSDKGKGVDQQCYAPKLQRFQCKLGAVGEFDEHTWLDFIAARRSIPDKAARLKEASVRFYLPRDMDFRQELIKRNVDIKDFLLHIENPSNPTFMFEIPRQYAPDESVFQWEDWYHPTGDYVDLMEDGHPDWDSTDEDLEMDADDLMDNDQVMSHLSAHLDFNLAAFHQAATTALPPPNPQP